MRGRFRAWGVVAALACGIGLAAPPGAGARVYGGTSATGATGATSVPFGATTNAAATRLVQLFVYVAPRCDDGQSAVYFGVGHRVASAPAAVPEGRTVFTGAALSPTGAVRLSGVGALNFGGDSGALTFTFSGHADGARLRGTLKGTLRLVARAGEHPPVTCAFTRIVHARSAPGVVFAGASDQAEPVVLELDAARRSIHRVRIAWAAPCRPQGTWFVPDDLVDFPLSRTGRFGDVFDTGPFDAGAGANSSYHYVLRGRLTGRRMTGTLEAGVRVLDATGAEVRACGPQAIRFDALTSAAG